MVRSIVPDRVEEMGFACAQGGVPRVENPYFELDHHEGSGEHLDAIQSLIKAWWRGWDRAGTIRHHKG